MSDLISRADAIEAVASITMSIHLSDVICDKLLALPSADAVSREEYEEVKAYMDTLVDAFIEDGEELAELVKVVRCKDCRHSRVYQTDSKGTMQTYCVAFIMSRTVTDDDFCSWGERREE